MEGSAWQATLGKRALGIKVTSLQGERIGFGQATGRVFAKVLSQMLFYAGYLVAAFTKQRQALHDRVASTLVVRRDASTAEIALAAPAARGDALLIVAVVAVAGIVVIGILAAIGIPAYQDYTIRAQVAHGLNLADPYKTAVAEALAAGSDSMTINSGPGGTIAVDTSSSGTYEDSVTVVTGNILIVYGRKADPHLTGRHLAVYAIQNQDRSLTWVCGRSAAAGDENGISARAFRHLTDVPDKYLPTSCRG